MKYKTILFEKQGPVALITLNQPNSLNALNKNLCAELLDSINKCRWDDQIKVVILTGNGKAFCAGGDLQIMRDFLTKYPNDNPGKIIYEMVTDFHPVILSLRKLKKPVIGAINGICSGGGAGLAQACDILIASRRAKLHMAYISIGEVPDGGNSYFLLHKVGLHKAAELIFTGASVDAQEAFNLGIFNKVVPDKNLLEEAISLALKLAQNSSFALGLAKEMLNRAISGSLETQLEIERDGVTKCAGTPEFKEGIRNFFKKENPN